MISGHAAGYYLFAQRGFAGAGISDIARAAGVSHGTVFLYFASKDALFRAAVLEPLEEFAARSLEIMDGEGSALVRHNQERGVLSTVRGFEVTATEEPLGVQFWYMERPAALGR